MILGLTDESSETNMHCLPAPTGAVITTMITTDVRLIGLGIIVSRRTSTREKAIPHTEKNLTRTKHMRETPSLGISIITEAQPRHLTTTGHSA